MKYLFIVLAFFLQISEVFSYEKASKSSILVDGDGGV